jgi:hypothetical protein
MRRYVVLLSVALAMLIVGIGKDSDSYVVGAMILAALAMADA